MGRDVYVRVGSKVERRLLNEGKENIGEENGRMAQMAHVPVGSCTHVHACAVYLARVSGQEVRAVRPGRGVKKW